MSENYNELTLEDVSIRFGDQAPVAEHVSLCARKKKRLVIVGESGSGKSVLILAALRLLPAFAAITGSIHFEGNDLLQCSEREMTSIRGRRIAYVPQGSGNGLNPVYTIGHQLKESLRLQHKTDKEQMAQHITQLLEQFDFPQGRGLLDMYPHMLSGGMRQRVLVAMGIAGGATLILADEPTKGLDPGRVEIVRDTFLSLHDKTLLVVTHDLRFARSIADDVAVMYASQLVEFGSGKNFFENPLHPYSRAMLAAMPENGLSTAAGFAPPRENKGSVGCAFKSRCPGNMPRCGESPPMVHLGKRRVRCWLYAEECK
jgi:peptide/nickel transport system ATP-binding protein